MTEFSPVPMIPEYTISSSGRILPNSICLKCVGSYKYIAIGTSEGELFLYEYKKDIPMKHAYSVGGIAIVKISFLSYFQKNMIVVITLENRCYFFELEGEENEWLPLTSQNLIFNPSCCVLFEGKTGTEILLGTHHGGLGYFVSDTMKYPKSVWRYSNNWNLGMEITSLTMIDKTHILVGRGDGNSLIYVVGENPERQSFNNSVCENFSKDGIYILVYYSQLTKSLIAVNGHGKLCLFQRQEDSKQINFTLSSEINIGKRPIFAGYLNQNQEEIGLVGCPDGTLYFISDKLKNFYRHEEPIQCYHLGDLDEPVLVIIGQSGFISFFTKFNLFDNKIPRFLLAAKDDIEELRNIIGDRDTSDESLVATYLYMPLP